MDFIELMRLLEQHCKEFTGVWCRKVPLYTVLHGMPNQHMPRCKNG
jgi:hypothetical protein